MWVLEANPRASRTVPFVSKAIGIPLAKVADAGAGRAARCRTCAPTGMLPPDPHHYRRCPYTSVKAAVLPFGRFPGVDTVLGPEMKSTGEVMGIDADSGHGAGQGARRRRRGAAAAAAPCSSAWRTATSARSSSRPSASPTWGSDCSRRGARPACCSAPGSRSSAVAKGVGGLAERRRADPRRAEWTWSSTRRSAAAAHRRLLHPHGRRVGRRSLRHDPARACSPRSGASRRCAGGPTEPRSIQEYHADAAAAPVRPGSAFEEARRRSPGRGRSGGRGVMRRVRAEILSTRQRRRVPLPHAGGARDRREGPPRPVRRDRHARGPRVPPAAPLLDPPGLAAWRLGRHARVRLSTPGGPGTEWLTAAKCARVPRRDRPARQGVRVPEAAHELPARSPRVTAPRRCTSWRRSCWRGKARRHDRRAPRTSSACSSRSRASACRRRSRS